MSITAAAHGRRQAILTITRNLRPVRYQAFLLQNSGVAEFPDFGVAGLHAFPVYALRHGLLAAVLRRRCRRLDHGGEKKQIVSLHGQILVARKPSSRAERSRPSM